MCFITATGGRRTFLGERIALHPGRLVDTAGVEVGRVDAIELVTIGQRKGLGLAGDVEPRYAVAVDATAGVVTVGPAEDLLTESVTVGSLGWSGPSPRPGAEVLAQTSAHGVPRSVVVTPGTALDTLDVRWVDGPQRRVAPGQSVAFYRDDVVLGGGIAR